MNFIKIKAYTESAPILKFDIVIVSGRWCLLTLPALVTVRVGSVSSRTTSDGTLWSKPHCFHQTVLHHWTRLHCLRQ